MSLNKFYTINDMLMNDSGLSCRIVFNPEHDIFKGHFPAQPVVPGVCMVEIVKELLQQNTGKHLLLKQAGNVKFLRLIIPATQPEVDLSWKSLESGYFVNVTFKEAGTILFKMDGTYDFV